METFYVISYDISNDRRRLKIMKTLKNFGERVQYSVFECRLLPAQFVELKRRLRKLVTQEDSLRFYALCAEDVQRIEVMGCAVVTAQRSAIIH